MQTSSEKQVVIRPVAAPTPTRAASIPSQTTRVAPAPAVRAAISPRKAAPAPSKATVDTSTLSVIPVTAPVPQREEVKAEDDGKPVYVFSKLWGVAEKLKFSDGSTFEFKLIRRNNMPGYSPTSSVRTSDEKLAANLRELAKTNRSIREAPASK